MRTLLAVSLLATRATSADCPVLLGRLKSVFAADTSVRVKSVTLPANVDCAFKIDVLPCTGVCNTTRRAKALALATLFDLWTKVDGYEVPYDSPTAITVWYGSNRIKPGAAPASPRAATDILKSILAENPWFVKTMTVKTNYGYNEQHFVFKPILTQTLDGESRAKDKPVVPQSRGAAEMLWDVLRMKDVFFDAFKGSPVFYSERLAAGAKCATTVRAF